MPEDGVETVSDEFQRESIAYMQRVYGVKITTIEKLLKQFVK